MQDDSLIDIDNYQLQYQESSVKIRAQSLVEQLSNIEISSAKSDEYTQNHKQFVRQQIIKRLCRIGYNKELIILMSSKYSLELDLKNIFLLLIHLIEFEENKNTISEEFLVIRNSAVVIEFEDSDKNSKIINQSEIQSNLSDIKEYIQDYQQKSIQDTFQEVVKVQLKEQSEEFIDIINISSNISNQDNNNDNNNNINNSNKNDNQIKTNNDDVVLNVLQQCGICQVEADQMEILNCYHHFCKECYQSYLIDKIVTAQISEIRCPYQGCTHVFYDNHLKQLLPTIYYEQYLRFKLVKEIDEDPNKKWCPRPGCDLFVQKNQKSDIVQCQCGLQICFKCGNKSHEGLKCENALEIEFKQALNKYLIKFCPKCKSNIQKISGCNHMTCSQCKFQFCWVCLQTYHQYHYRYWAINGCAIWSNGRYKQCAHIKNPTLRRKIYCFPRLIVYIFRGPLIILRLILKGLWKSFVKPFRLTCKGLKKIVENKKIVFYFVFLLIVIISCLVGIILMPFVFLIRQLPKELQMLKIKGCAY